MHDLERTATAFADMAHRIVWCSVATVDRHGQPWTRILHPYWVWDGEELTGYVCTGKTPVKAAHLAGNDRVSVSYWSPTHDTCTANATARWLDAPEDRRVVWDMLKGAPEPVGYDPAMIPGWSDPDSEAFGALCLRPHSLRVFPGTVLLGQGGEVLTWKR
jgi:hypothetical protein